MLIIVILIEVTIFGICGYLKEHSSRYEVVKISFSSFEKFFILAPEKYELKYDYVIYDNKIKLIFPNFPDTPKYIRFHKNIEKANSRSKENIKTSSYLRDVQKDINSRELISSDELRRAKELMQLL